MRARLLDNVELTGAERIPGLVVAINTRRGQGRRHILRLDLRTFQLNKHLIQAIYSSKWPPTLLHQRFGIVRASRCYAYNTRTSKKLKQPKQSYNIRNDSPRELFIVNDIR